jgi:hypothetical protein
LERKVSSVTFLEIYRIRIQILYRKGRRRGWCRWKLDGGRRCGTTLDGRVVSVLFFAWYTTQDWANGTLNVGGIDWEQRKAFLGKPARNAQAGVLPELFRDRERVAWEKHNVEVGT